MSKNPDSPLWLFLGDTKGDRPIFEVWAGSGTDELYLQIDGWNTMSFDVKSFNRLIEALQLAKLKYEEAKKPKPN